MYQHSEKRHGRTSSYQVGASKALNEYLDWPHLAQVVRIERRWHKGGAIVCIEPRYLVTSLAGASAERLYALARGHWGIENRLHWVRDVSMGEDASQVSKGSGPEVIAALRNAVLSVLHLSGIWQIAATLQYNIMHIPQLIRSLTMRPLL